MDKRFKTLIIFAVVTLLIIITCLALFYDLRDLIFEDIRLPFIIETARGSAVFSQWC